MSNNIKFARNLVKGKIAETLFAQMHREIGDFTVLEFGYEKIIPEIVQQGYKEDNETLDVLRTAPDFAVIDRKNKEVKLIEVKYLKNLETKYVLDDAIRMSQSWNPSYLFVASSSGFYFDNIQKIKDNNGEISKLTHIPEELQLQYLKILNDFEKGGN